MTGPVERLGDALGRIRPGFDEDEAVAIARGGIVRAETRRTAGQAGRRLRAALLVVLARLAGTGPRTRLALAGAAAVAVAALFALPSPDPMSPDPMALTPRPEAAGDDVFSIEAPDDRGMAVFQTKNPHIRVVWFTDPIGSGD